MRYRLTTRLLPPTLIAVLISTVAACASTADLPPVSDDGLQLRNSPFDELYIRDDAQFETYTSVYSEPVNVEFDERWIRQQRSSGVWKMEDKDRERIITGLDKEFREIFLADFAAANNLRIVTTAESDSLLLKPAVTRLRIYNPDSFQPGRETVLVEETGRATLELEILDTESTQSLLRMSNRTRGRNYGGTYRAQTRVQNRQDTIFIMRRWAERMNIVLATHAGS